MRHRPVLVFIAAAAFAGEFPEASISNGAITARFYLPDAGGTYYCGTRFDWSGVTYSLKTNAGAGITGDRPHSKLVYRSMRTVFSPEPYIELAVEPGQSMRWTYRYEFFDLP
jgi:hypothetical protein